MEKTGLTIHPSISEIFILSYSYFPNLCHLIYNQNDETLQTLHGVTSLENSWSEMKYCQVSDDINHTTGI